MAERALIGAVLAAVIAVFARRLGALTASGQWAACAVGVVTAAAGWT